MFDFATTTGGMAVLIVIIPVQFAMVGEQIDGSAQEDIFL